MAQFDVHRNRNPRSAKTIPYLLDVQHGILGGIATRIVVPLELTDDRAAARLNPRFEIEGKAVVMVTTALAAVMAASLSATVANLGERRTEILDAPDFLWCGY